MTPENSAQPTLGSRVSILARLVPAFSYAIPMLGAAVSAFMFFGVLHAMRNAESAGVAAVADGMAEANIAIIVALYLGAFVGFLGIVVTVIRMFVSTKSASPSAWFFLIVGGLSFIPTALLWEAQTLLAQTIANRGNVALVAQTLNWCLTLAVVTAAAFGLLFLIASLVPLPTVFRARRSYMPLIVLVLMEFMLIGLAIGFQLHNSWLYQVKLSERF
jgi:hypothetical protein